MARSSSHPIAKGTSVAVVGFPNVNVVGTDSSEVWCEVDGRRLPGDPSNWVTIGADETGVMTVTRVGKWPNAERLDGSFGDSDWVAGKTVYIFDDGVQSSNFQVNTGAEPKVAGLPAVVVYMPKTSPLRSIHNKNIKTADLEMPVTVEGPGAFVAGTVKIATSSDVRMKLPVVRDAAIRAGGDITVNIGGRDATANFKAGGNIKVSLRDGIYVDITAEMSPSVDVRSNVPSRVVVRGTTSTEPFVTPGINKAELSILTERGVGRPGDDVSPAPANTSSTAVARAVVADYFALVAAAAQPHTPASETAKDEIWKRISENLRLLGGATAKVNTDDSRAVTLRESPGSPSARTAAASLGAEAVLALVERDGLDSRSAGPAGNARDVALNLQQMADRGRAPTQIDPTAGARAVKTLADAVAAARPDPGVSTQMGAA